LPVTFPLGPPAWALLLALSFLPTWAAYAAEPIPFEIGLAAREAGHLRALFSELDKQNVLYHYHLGSVGKQELQETAAQIDRIMSTLEKGSPAYSIAPPVTRGIRDQLIALDDEWGKLRRLALASPYDYLRLSNNLMPKRARANDPLNIQIFTEMSTTSIAEADKLQQLIIAECSKTGYEFCEAARRSGAFNMRVQRIAKLLVLAFAGIDQQDNLKLLRADVKQLDENLNSLAESPIVTGALAESRGRSAEFVRGLWASIQEGWANMRFEADLAVEGRVEGLDIQRMLKAQRELVDDLDRFRAALSRYAEAQLAG
jgi:hypothetical protein